MKFAKIPRLFLTIASLVIVISPAAIAGGVNSLSDQAQSQQLGSERFLRDSRDNELDLNKARQELSIPSSPPISPIRAENDVKIDIKKILLVGNTLITTEKIMSDVPMITESLDQKLGIAELDEIARAITNYYRDEGYFVASAYLLEQKIDKGEVTITIYEGAVGETIATGVEGYSTERLTRYLKQALCNNPNESCEGTVLHRSNAERAVGVIRDIPGIGGTFSELAPAGDTGMVDYTLNSIASEKNTGIIRADNFGNKYSGRNRGILGYVMNNPFGYGDLLSFDLSSTFFDSNSGAINYDFPIGYDGWRVSLGYSHAEYSLGGTFSALEQYGQSDVLQSSISYPIIRSQASNMFLSGSLEHRRFKDNTLGTSARKYNDAASLGLSGDFIDGLLAGSLTGYGISVTAGDMDAKSNGIVASEVQGGYNKLDLYVLRDQSLTYFGTGTSTPSRLGLYFNFRGQYTKKRLNTVESFSLGGPSGVRAYPIGEASGDRGYITSLELRYSRSLPIFNDTDVTVAMFRDEGFVTTIPFIQGGALIDGNGRRLKGSGLSISIDRQDYYSFKLSWARRDGDSPAATTDKDDLSRLWLSAGFYY